jgi:hypothetical protein
MNHDRFGVICDLHLGSGQQLPLWISDQACNAAGSDGLRHQQWRSEQQGRCRKPGKSHDETVRGLTVQDHKPSIPTIHLTSLLKLPFHKLGCWIGNRRSMGLETVHLNPAQAKQNQKHIPTNPG